MMVRHRFLQSRWCHRTSPRHTGQPQPRRPITGASRRSLVGQHAAVLPRAQEGFRELVDAAFPAPATLCAPGRPATQLRRRFVQTISYRHRDTVQTAESDASPSLRCRVAAAEAKPLTNCCAPTVTFPLLDSTPLAQLADPAERAHAYAGRSKSAATIRACAVGWRDYLSFCERAAPRPCPPRIRLWRPTWRTWHTAGAKAATIARRMGGH